LQIIDAEAQRCAKLVNDLIEFGRPRDSAFSPTDIGSVIAKSLTFISNRLYKGKIEPLTQIAPNLPPLFADAVQIEQVLLNLNAIDAMPDGGKLIVGVAISDSSHQGEVPEIIVSVADSGRGIDEHMLPHIFRPFLTMNKKHGLGLGLAVSERIIRNHGGRIEVESQLQRDKI
jgi:signal transduction histidine kinase